MTLNEALTHLSPQDLATWNTLIERALAINSTKDFIVFLENPKLNVAMKRLSPLDQAYTTIYAREDNGYWKVDLKRIPDHMRPEYKEFQNMLMSELNSRPVAEEKIKNQPAVNAVNTDDLVNLPSDPREIQIGGDHYKQMKIQPWEAMEAWLTREEYIGFLRGNIIKYQARANSGKENKQLQLRKAGHYQMELERFLAAKK